MSKNNKPISPVDVSGLEITNDEYSNERSPIIGKYDSFFRSLKMGQRIKCPPGDVAKLSNAFRDFLRRNKLGGTVKAKTRHTDGQGGVWWLKEAA